MKLTLNLHRQSQRGSILVICMVLAGVGTIGAAAFFSLIHAKSEESHQRENAMIRRTKQANAKVLAKEAVLRLHVGASVAPTGGVQNFALADNWGSVTIASHPNAPLAASAATRTNKTGIHAPTAFSEDFVVTLNDGSATHRFQAQAKSFSPVLAGDLLVAQRPAGTGTGATQFTGNLYVKGRAVFHPADYSTNTSTLRADRVLMANATTPKLSLLNTAGTAILPENGARPATTSGVVGGAVAFDGRSNVIANPNSAINDYVDYIAGRSGSIVSDGLPFVTTESPDTSPANANDALVTDLINAITGPLTGTLATALRPYRPLSSQSLTALIGKTTAVDATVLTSILVENSPLPKDILQLVASGNAPVGPNQLYILQANPVGVALTNAGLVYVDLDSTAAVHTVITGPVTSLILAGQEDTTSFTNAAALSPIVISCVGTGATSLSSITMEGRNNRPVILALHQPGDYVTSSLNFTGTTAFPTWRSIIELEGHALNVNTSTVSAATLIGGIRTDRSINVSGGTLTLDRETDLVTSLQGIASRQAWLELLNIP